jgi:hypothetical protein
VDGRDKPGHDGALGPGDLAWTLRQFWESLGKSQSLSAADFRAGKNTLINYFNGL